MTRRGLRGARRRRRPTRRVVAWLQRARPAREARALPPRGRHLRALPHRASSRSSRRSGGARWTSSRGRRSRRCASGASRYHPESQHRFAIESLEQAPDWCVSRQLWWGHQIPIWTCPDGHRTVRVAASRRRARECGSARARRATRTCSTRGSRRRSGRSRRSAGPSRRPSSSATTRATSTSTAREIIRLWENRMIFSGLFLLGEIPFTDVIITLDRAGRRRPAHVEEPRHRHRPARGGAQARRRRDALRPAEDVVDAGRRASPGRDRGGRRSSRTSSGTSRG